MLKIAFGIILGDYTKITMKKAYSLMKAVKEFNRFAVSYAQYNIIQRQVAKRLVSNFTSNKLGTILDIGCGEGEIFRQLREQNINFERLIGIDLSNEMLKLHPKNEKIELYQYNFDDPTLPKSLKEKKINTIVSASALQWSKDLNQTLNRISNLGEESAFAIFTSGTFRTLHHYAKTSSPIRSYREVEELLQKYYYCNKMEKIEYQLEFKTKDEIFSYIKRSGVSGGEARLSYQQIRHLIQHYPLNYLEFELLFFLGKPKRSFSKA